MPSVGSLARHRAQCVQRVLDRTAMIGRVCQYKNSTYKIVDKTGRLSHGPDTSIWVAVLVHGLAASTRHKRQNLGDLRTLRLFSQYLLRHDVLVDTGRVAERAQNVSGVALRRVYDVLLNVFVNVTFLRSHETRTHCICVKKTQDTYCWRHMHPETGLLQDHGHSPYRQRQ